MLCTLLGGQGLVLRRTLDDDRIATEYALGVVVSLQHDFRVFVEEKLWKNAIVNGG